MFIRPLTAAAAAFLIGMATVPAVAATDSYCKRFPTQRELGLLIPAYFYPTAIDPDSQPAKDWETLIRDAKRAAAAGVRFAVIVNPGINGTFNAEDPNYTRVINALDEAGALILGYVYTSLGKRAQTDVEADMAAYRSFYPQIDGFFIDEAKVVQDRYGYYGRLRQAAVRLFGGDVLIFGNSGIYPADQRYDEFFDVTVVFEDRMRNYDRSGLPAAVRRAAPSRNAYIINDALGSPPVNLKNRACSVAYSLRFRTPAVKNGGWWFLTTDGSAGGPAAYSSLGTSYPHVFQATCAANTGKPCP